MASFEQAKPDLSATTRKLGTPRRGIVTLSLTFLLLAFTASAANFCVGPSSSGNGSGSDWNNRIAWSSLSPSRGNTYYVMEGSYSGKTFSTATSGSSTITIKKATPAEHGSSTGWSDTMGDAVAQFNGQISFTRGYFVFDGVTGGGPGSWKSGYGFKVSSSSGPCITVPWDAAGNNITVRHVEVQGGGPDGAGSPPNDGIHIGNRADNMTVSYAWIHDMGRTLFFISGDNVTLEYIYGGQFESVAEQHAESMSCWEGSPQTGPGCNNLTVRWSVFDYFRATGGIIVEGSGTKVYGCVFWGPPGQSSSFTGQAVIGTWSSRKWQNGLVYNNTFYDLGGCAAHGLWTAEDNGTFRNNLYIDTSVGGYPGGTVSHNHYDGSGSYGSSVTTGAVNLQSTEWTSADFFKPTANTPAGAALGDPYNVDMYGSTRSTWTRGAVEFGSGTPDTTPPAVTLTSPASGAEVSSSITLSAAASDTGGSGVASVSFLVNGVSVGTDTTSPYSVGWDSRTLPNGTHTIQARAADGAGNQSTSGSVSINVQNPDPDTAPPTAALTTPVGGAVISNTVTLTATAADNANGSGVSSVSFLLDGSVLSDDNSAPYTLSWNTRTVTNGSYSLQARAFDVAGNQGSSAVVSVQVQNPPLGTSFEAEEGDITSPFGVSNGLIGQTILTDLSGGGRAVYTFTTSQSGEYLVSATVDAPSLTENSFYLNIDAEPQEPAMTWDILPPTSGFENRFVSWRGSGTADTNEFVPKFFNLSQGTHQLIIRGREPNTLLDRISILKVPEPPKGLQVVGNP